MSRLLIAVVVVALVAAGGVFFFVLGGPSDAAMLRDEIAAGGRDHVLETIAASATKTGVAVTAINSVSDPINLGVDAAVATVTADPALVGVLDTERVLNRNDLRAADAAIAPALARAEAAHAEVDRLKDGELAALDALALDLPDERRAALLAIARARSDAERESYHALVDAAAARVQEWQGMIAFCLFRQGSYDFYRAEARARFEGASIDGEYLGFISRLRRIGNGETETRAGLATARVDTSLAMVDAADAKL